MRLGFLGPAGTFSEQAVLEAGLPGERVACPTIRDAVLAVQERRVDRALVPVENAIEGSVDATWDALADAGPDVVVVGERVLAVRTCLVLAPGGGEVGLVLSHPQPLGQCAGFLRRALPGVPTRATSSTAEAVREVVAHGGGWGALAPRAAAEAHGGVVVQEGVDDDPDNRTRFLWLAREAAEPDPGRPAKTSVLFAGAGDATPGWLVACLGEFADRGVNLTRIATRPLRQTLGHYRFFVDAEGAGPEVRAAVDALRGRCEQVRVLGAYAAA